MSTRTVVAAVTAAVAAVVPTAWFAGHHTATPAAAPVAAARPVTAAVSRPGTIVDGYPRPLPASGPDLVAHDPSMVQAADGRWYVFSTSEGIEVRSSADQRTWRREKPVFPNGTAIGKAFAKDPTDMWAPDVTKVGNRYVMYYAGSKFGTNVSAIGLATSPTALPGTWTDRGLVISTTTGDQFNAIDPNLFVDPSGAAYLTFGSFFGGIGQIRLDPSTGKRIAGDTSAPKLVATRPDHPLDAIEAPSLSKVGSYYYLSVAFDFCCSDIEASYRTMVGRSTSPTGPFVDRVGRPMLLGGGTQVMGTHDDIIGPGGADVSHDSLGWQVVYHYYDGLAKGIPHLAINDLVLDGQGWPHLEPTG